MSKAPTLLLLDPNPDKPKKNK